MKKTFTLWNRFRNIFSNLGEHPSYDWYFSLACLGILALAAIGLSGFIYYALALRGVEYAEPAPATEASLDREALAKALDDMRRSDISARAIPNALLADPSRR
jgi:hypothetical protein